VCVWLCCGWDGVTAAVGGGVVHFPLADIGEGVKVGLCVCVYMCVCVYVLWLSTARVRVVSFGGQFFVLCECVCTYSFAYPCVNICMCVYVCIYV